MADGGPPNYIMNIYRVIWNLHTTNKVVFEFSPRNKKKVPLVNGTLRELGHTPHSRRLAYMK